MKKAIPISFILLVITVLYWCLPSCTKTEVAEPSEQAKKISMILDQNEVTMDPVEVQQAMNGDLRSFSPCPLEYDNPHGFEYPLGDSCEVDEYRIIRRVLNGDTIYSFNSQDLLNLLSQFDQQVDYSPYDLVKDNHISTGDLLAFLPHYGADPIEDIHLDLFEIGLNAQTGQLDQYSSGLGLYYHEEMVPIVVDSVNYNLPYYGPGITNGFLFPSMGDETSMFSCWHSADIVLFGAPQYQIAR